MENIGSHKSVEEFKATCCCLSRLLKSFYGLSNLVILHVINICGQL